MYQTNRPTRYVFYSCKTIHIIIIWRSLARLSNHMIFWRAECAVRPGADIGKWRRDRGGYAWERAFDKRDGRWGGAVAGEGWLDLTRVYTATDWWRSRLCHLGIVPCHHRLVFMSLAIMLILVSRRVHDELLCRFLLLNLSDAQGGEYPALSIYLVHSNWSCKRTFLEMSNLF